MRVVVSASPIRALAFVDQLELLKGLFGEVFIPPAVASELTSPRSRFAPLSLSKFPFIRIQAPADMSLVRRFRRTLDAGESEAIALAMELHADVILIDERRGRSIALGEGLAIIGAVGVLVRGKNAGMLPAVRPMLDRLEHELGFFISAVLREEVLSLTGE